MIHSFQLPCFVNVFPLLLYLLHKFNFIARMLLDCYLATVENIMLLCFIIVTIWTINYDFMIHSNFVDHVSVLFFSQSLCPIINGPWLSKFLKSFI